MSDRDPRAARLDDFRRLLDGATAAGSAVFVERHAPLPANTRQAILIDPSEESVLEDEGTFDAVDVDEAIELSVRVSCVGRTPAERDALARDARRALDAGLSEGIHRGLVSTSFTKDGDIDPPVFAAHMTYRAVYTT